MPPKTDYYQAAVHGISHGYWGREMKVAYSHEESSIVIHGAGKQTSLLLPLEELPKIAAPFDRTTKRRLLILKEVFEKDLDGGLLADDFVLRDISSLPDSELVLLRLTSIRDPEQWVSFSAVFNDRGEILGDVLAAGKY